MSYQQSDAGLDHVVDQNIYNPMEEADSVAEADPVLTLVPTHRGGEQLCVDGYMYYKNKKIADKTYWECENRQKKDQTICRAKAITTQSDGVLKLISRAEHTHTPNAEKLHIKMACSAIKKQLTLRRISHAS